MKITVDKALIEHAIAALESLDGLDTETECVTIHVGDEIDALRAALAEPVVEPVAYRYKYLNFMGDEVWSQDLPSNGKVLETQALYASPALEPVNWKGLTDVQWMNIVNLNRAWFGFSAEETAHEVAKLTEAQLKKNNAPSQLAHSPLMKPVASIYITPEGAREFDDWKVPLPVGRNELYTSPPPPAEVPLISDDEWKALGYLTEFDRWRAKVTEAAVRRKAGL